MARIRIRQEIVQSALDRSSLETAEKEIVLRLIKQHEGKRTVDAQPYEYPQNFLKVLIEEPRITPNQRALVVAFIQGFSPGAQRDYAEVMQTRVSNPLLFGTQFGALSKGQYNAETYINGRWYPANYRVEFVENKNGDVTDKTVYLQAGLLIGDTAIPSSMQVDRATFYQEDGESTEITVEQVLLKLGLRPVQVNMVEYERLVREAEMFRSETGHQYWLSNHAVNTGRGSATVQKAGSPENPDRVVIEPTLEISERDRQLSSRWMHHNVRVVRTPFIRCFDLDRKMYIHADIRDLTQYDYDKGAIRRLQLPEEMVTTLRAVFEASPQELVGDLIRQKHGGVVIVASGNSGVGKTLTAEAYAEHSERPLYSLQIGELGTRVDVVEENLRVVFDRVIKWDAVLQFDECDVFLAKRTPGDLERSAIVGIFLRLLDYYSGIMFLTTNRPEVIDPAIHSRTMLHLRYPDLDHARLAKVWQEMFKVARLRLPEGITYQDVASLRLTNGRIVKNCTRLIRILLPRTSSRTEENGEITVTVIPCDLEREVSLDQNRHALNLCDTSQFVTNYIEHPSPEKTIS